MKIDNGTYLRDKSLWMQGGIDAEGTCLTAGGNNAWRLICPIRLQPLSKILYHVPAGMKLLALAGQKNADAETGDINRDYTFPLSPIKWRTKHRELCTINDTVYAMFVIMREDESPLDFEDITVRFYAPEKDVIPAYWLPSLEKAEWKILDQRRRFGQNAVEFFYLTDVHWIDNAQRSPAILNYITERTGEHHVVFGGDMIRRYNPNKDHGKQEVRGFYDWLSEDIKIFTTLGNHDRNYSSGNTNRALRFSEEETYELYDMKRAESFAVMENDPSHGYYDDVEHKVRMVQFYLSDSMFNMPEDSYVDGALDWVEKKIMELEEGWTVILFTHAYSRGTNPDGSYIITEKNKQISQRLLNIKKTARAELAFWITGHIHDDLYDCVSDGETSLQLISVLSDGYLYANSPTAARMVPTTDTEQAIDHVLVDLDRREIRFTRIGAGEDRLYRY